MSFFEDASLVLIPSGYKTSKVYSVKPTDGTGDLTFTRSTTATRVGPDGLIEKVRTNLQTYSQLFSNAVWVKSAGATLTHSQTDPNGGTTASRLQMPSGTSNYLAASAITGLTNGGQYTHSVYMKSNTGSTQSVRVLDGVRGVAGGTLLASVTTSWQRFEVVITTASTSAGLQIDNQSGTFANDILIAFAQTEVSDFGATPYIPTTTAAVSVGMLANVPRLDYLNSSCPRLLLEPQRTNLLQYSEQFNNAYWQKDAGTSVTANAATSPDGSANADRLSFISSGNAIYRSALGLSGAHRFSVYLKGDGANIGKEIYLEIAGGTSINVTLTGSWQRFTAIADNGSSVAIKRLNSGQADSVLAWGCQLELGSYATSYIPTLGAAVTRSADAASKTGISSVFGATATTYFIDVIIDNLNPSGGQWTLTAATNSSNFLSLSQFDAGTRTPRFAFFVDGAGVFDYTGSALSAGRHKIAAMVKNGSQKFYIDGVLIASNTGSGYTQFDKLALNDAVWAGPLQNGQFPFNQVLIFPTELTNAQLAELTTI